MINTLFLTLQLSNPLLLLSFSTRKNTSMASRGILSNFFESGRPRQWVVFSFNTVGNEYIRKTLINLDPRKAVGMDNISSLLLRLFAPSIAVEVIPLINYFIWTQSIPTEWKSSNIIQVYKKGSKSEKSNHRPVSILTSFSRVFEKTLEIRCVL